MSLSPLRGFDPIEPGQDFGEAFTAGRMQAIEQAIKEVHEGRNLKVGRGLQKGSSAQGASIRERRRRGGAGAVTQHPWLATVISSTKVKVLGGFVNSVEVFTDELVVGGGTRYIYLNVHATPNVVNSFVTGGVVTVATFGVGETLPTEDGTSGDFVIPLVKTVDRVISIQYQDDNIGFRPRDPGDGSGESIGQYYPGGGG